MANESKTINRLKGAEMFKFLKWFEEAEFAYGITDSHIAVCATDALGFTVTAGNVYGAWGAVGKARPKAPSSDSQKFNILKRAIELLYKDVGSTLPPEWLDL